MIFKRVSPSTTINFYLTAQHRVKHFSLNSTGRGHCNPTERHQNRAENVFRALWLQNVWFCAFSRFSIKFWQDEVFCTLTLWFPRFIASSQSGGSEFGKPQHLGTFRQTLCKVGPTQTSAVICTLSSDASGASNHNDFPHRPFQYKRRLTFLPVFLLSCRPFSLSLTECSIHSGGKGMQTRSMPCRGVGRGQSFDKGLLQITFLPSLLPLSLWVCRFFLVLTLYFSVCPSPSHCGSVDYGVGL